MKKFAVAIWDMMNGEMHLDFIEAESPFEALLKHPYIVRSDEPYRVYLREEFEAGGMDAVERAIFDTDAATKVKEII